MQSMTMVLSRESISISSVYAIVIPVRPLFATSSFTQSTGIHSDTVIGTALRRACGASCIRLCSQKSGNLFQQIAFFLFFQRKNWHDFFTPFSTFANIKGSLPIIRLRLIDCDGGPKQTMKTFPGFGQLFF